MRAIQGICDGNRIMPLEKLPYDKKYRVIITFLEELENDDEVRNLSSQASAFEFWNNEAEDIYQDYLHRKNQ